VCSRVAPGCVIGWFCRLRTYGSRKPLETHASSAPWSADAVANTAPTAWQTERRGVDFGWGLQSRIRERTADTANAAAASASDTAASQTQQPPTTAAAVEGYVPAARKKDGRRVKFNDVVETSEDRAKAAAAAPAVILEEDAQSGGGSVASNLVPEGHAAAAATATVSATSSAASAPPPPVLEFAIMNLTEAEFERTKGTRTFPTRDLSVTEHLPPYASALFHVLSNKARGVH